MINITANQSYTHGDSEIVLKTLKSKSFDLIITSPPYNVGKEYETEKSIEEYLSKHKKIIKQLVRLLSDKGSICWQVGNYVNQDKEIFPLDIFYYAIFKKLGLKLKNRIIWHFGHGLHSNKRFSGRYEVIMWFTKTDDYIFNLDPVRVPSKYPGKTHYKGPNKGKVSGNPKGKNPADVWEITLEDWEQEIWNIPNVNANHKEKTEHPCQYPIELVERCILALTDENSQVLDPYAGVGSTLIAAALHNRKAVGIESVEKYISIGQDRLDKLKKNELKFRKMGTPIHIPSPKDKVAQIPAEWLK